MFHFSSGVAVLFSTTFCAEMQCRFFFAVFISFQCFICAVIFHRVIFVCSLCRYICDFVSFVKVFNMQLQGVLGIFQQRSCAEMQCRCLCSFHQFSMFCLHSNFSLCNFCLLVVQLLLRFCFFRKNFQYAVARCVGYFTTTFCAEMQCRFFLCSFHQFSMFCLSRNLSPCILSVGCAVAIAILFFAEVLVFLYVNCRGGCRKKYHGWAVCLFQLFFLCSGFVA